MGWIIALIVVVVAGAFGIGERPAGRRRRAEEDRWQVENDPALLAKRDPVEALQRCGTDADAARLIAEGRGDDLAGLGDRPPD